MKTTVYTLTHLKGEHAYHLYWEQVYKCQPRLSSIMAIDLNLEIITDSDLNIIAYRCDLPEDMKWMVINACLWQFVNKKNYNSEVINEVKAMIIRNYYNCCKN